MRSKKSKRSRLAKDAPPIQNGDLLSKQLSDNKKNLQESFARCADIIIHPYRFGPEFSYESLVIYCETLVQEHKLNFLKSALQDLVIHEIGPATMITIDMVMSFFSQQGVSAEAPQLLERKEEAVKDVLKGHVVIFFDGWDKALSFKATSVETRQVSEPQSEVVVRGPHVGTIEDLDKNIGLLRIRLENPLFKIESFQAGQKVNTKVVFCYLEGTVNDETLLEFKRRVAKIHKEDILETSFIEELIEDQTYTPFPQFRYTERPDTAVAALLEGKILVLCQGTGSIMICPALFWEFFQSSEDYYLRTVIASILRQLRIFAFLISLLLPSIYIALSTFHPELIPTVLLLAILDTREGIPFPTLVEGLLMLLFFELLWEAGIRLPNPVGSAVSIVGALIIGEAAIQAGIASPIMVVVISLTGISSFAIPQYGITITLRVLRVPFMVLSATLGGFGVMMGLLWLHLHLTKLRSLGQPYLAPLAPLRIKQLRDILIRAPLKVLLRSPRYQFHKSPKN
jgi:spore germination protein